MGGRGATQASGCRSHLPRAPRAVEAPLASSLRRERGTLASRAAKKQPVLFQAVEFVVLVTAILGG